ncbi:hypothetical protein OIV83_003790 [Microbotryomycetes sp. JL201]|nr:hypothetical protein OIV83_003790 [Microbotryomycetes sp. JL201]
MVVSDSSDTANAQASARTAPTPPPADYPTSAASQPVAATSIDQDLNKSTQRLLVETLWTAGTYLLYSIGALLTWSTTKLLWLVEKLLFGLAWLTQWLAVITFCLILLFIILTSAVLGIYKLEPQIRAFRRQQPVASKLALEAAYHVPVLILSRFIWTWVYQLLVILALARLAANSVGVDWVAQISRMAYMAFDRPSARRRGMEATTNAQDMSEERLKPIIQALERAERERAERQAKREKESVEADKWTRQWQEQMVNEGLRKRAQQQASAAAAAAAAGGGPATGTKDSDSAGADSSRVDAATA